MLPAWKVSKNGVFSGPYLVRMLENTDQKKLSIWALFTQWLTGNLSLREDDRHYNFDKGYISKLPTFTLNASLGISK